VPPKSKKRPGKSLNPGTRLSQAFWIRDLSARIEDFPANGLREVAVVTRDTQQGRDLNSALLTPTPRPVAPRPLPHLRHTAAPGGSGRPERKEFQSNYAELQ
jgi:hypothetical protein